MIVEFIDINYVDRKGSVSHLDYYSVDTVSLEDLIPLENGGEGKFILETEIT